MSKIISLISKEEIAKKVEELADSISNDYKGGDLLVVGILKGAYIFMADLVRRLKIPVKCDFVKVSSYGSGAKSSGKIRFDLDLSCSICGKDVLLVEDIIDTGLTLKALRERLHTFRPNSLKICAFLDKPSRREVEIEADYPAIKVPDKFLVGYGLDADEKFRELPFVGYLEEEDK